MPAAHPPELCRSAVELARLWEKSIAAIAKDLGISESCLRGWVNRADIDEGNRDGVTYEERAKLVRLVQEIADDGIDVAVALPGAGRLAVGLLRVAFPAAAVARPEDAYLANTVVDFPNVARRLRSSAGAR